jgi:hypothetical protein
LPEFYAGHAKAAISMGQACLAISHNAMEKEYSLF